MVKYCISANRFHFHIIFPSLQVEWVLNGTWDSKMEGSKVIGEAFVKGKSSLGMASCFRFCFPTLGSGSRLSFLATDIIRCVWTKTLNRMCKTILNGSVYWLSCFVWRSSGICLNFAISKRNFWVLGEMVSNLGKISCNLYFLRLKEMLQIVTLTIWMFDFRNRCKQTSVEENTGRSGVRKILQLHQVSPQSSYV